MDKQAATFTVVLVTTLGLCAFRSWSRNRPPAKPHSTDDRVLSSTDEELHKALHTFQTSTLATRGNDFRSANGKAFWRLNNPFVSTSITLQRRYREALLRQFSRTDWIAIAQTTAVALQPHLRLGEGRGLDGDVVLAVRDATRGVTLAAVLQGLFGIDNVAHDTLVYISTEIHELNLAKKAFDKSGRSARDVPQVLQNRVDKLVNTLRSVFSSGSSSAFLVNTVLCAPLVDDEGVETSQEFNPLNLILPAFEAPWRAVFYTLLATLQQTPARPRDVLTLRDSCARAPPSGAAIAIAHESLRLYPPIRRVRRDYQVDIESIQRDESRWGPAAVEFQSSRFLTDDGHGGTTAIPPPDAWLPFAAGSMKCPSAYGWGVRLIVTVAGEMLRQLFPEGRPLKWRLEGDEWDEAAQGGKVLRAGREEYASVRLYVGPQ